MCALAHIVHTVRTGRVCVCVCLCVHRAYSELYARGTSCVPAYVRVCAYVYARAYSTLMRGLCVPACVRVCAYVYARAYSTLYARGTCERSCPYVHARIHHTVCPLALLQC